MEDNRTPLSYREYKALRQLFGMVSVFTTNIDELHRRMKDIPGAWRDSKLITSLSDKLMANLLKTVPQKKLALIKKELDSTRCEVNIINTVTPDDTMFAYVPTLPMERVTNEAMKVSCQFCEKCGKEARECQLRKDITSLYMWDFPKIADGQECYFSAGTMIGDFAK